jgi:hypothetical protein
MPKFNNKIFIEKSKLVHGDKYDYSFVNYINKKSKVKIICKKHGEFEQIPYCHYYFKQGCPKCKINKQLNTEDFIERSKQIHGDKYDYSLVQYKNAYTKVDIICREHGIFKMLPNDHKKSGCSLCNLGYVKNNNINEIEYMEKCRIIHGDKYDYSKTKYINSRSKVIITCKIHGDFYQKAESHLRGRGCPNCKNSVGENKIELYLKNKNILYEKQMIFQNCKNISFLPFDFYLTKYNICIEFDGIQHFVPVKYFGGVDNYKIRKKLDKIKNEYCKNKIFI